MVEHSCLRSVCALWGNKLVHISVYLIEEELIVLITDGGRVRGGSADGKEGREERRGDFRDYKQRR